jgi:hypothetical protein
MSERQQAEVTVPLEPSEPIEKPDPIEMPEPVEKPEPVDSPPAADEATSEADEAGAGEEAGAAEKAGAADEAGAAAPDPWEAFGPAPERSPGRVGRIAARVGYRLGAVASHELTLAALGSLLLAVVMTWPTLRHPATTIPEDLGDPTLVAYLLSWSGHALVTDPANLWNTNAFFPEHNTLAFTDSLLGYAPLGMVGSGPVAALVRYNILYVLICALAFFGTYVLARQLGAGRMGSAVAGAAFACAPWRLVQAGHLHVLSTGGMALALAMLARGHGYSFRHGFRQERVRWGWALAGWLVAAWQITIGFGIGLVFAYVLAAICVAAAVTWYVRRTQFWAVRRRLGWKVVVADLGGGLAFAGVCAGMAYPYLQVIKDHPYARRTVQELALYSPPLRGFFVAPQESWLWGDGHADARASLPFVPEMALLPGFFLYGLAIGGLFFSVWKVYQRLLLAFGVVASIALGMGTNGPAHGKAGYLLLYQNLPGFDAIRTSGRLVIWTTLLLALLAAGGVSAFAERAKELRADRSERAEREFGFAMRFALVVPLLLVLAEGVNGTPHPVMPPSPVAMHTLKAPVLVLPSENLPDLHVMLWSTDGYPKIVNGYSGFVPQRLQQLQEQTKNFPDADSVQVLHDLGVKTVVVQRSRVTGTAYERALDAPIDDLDLTRVERGDVVIYSLE